jgi:hypothetical protein
VQGCPVCKTSQRTLRVRQQEHALEARRFLSLLYRLAGWVKEPEGHGDCPEELDMAVQTMWLGKSPRSYVAMRKTLKSEDLQDLC